MDTANHEPKKKTDYISRIIDSDDWGLPLETFHLLSVRWGPFDMDWFVSEHNAKLPRFYSRFSSEGCASVDAHTADWENCNGYFFISIISRVFKQMILCRAYGVLVLPLWRSAKFWPLFCCKDGYLIHTITDMTDLPLDKSSYVPCKNGKGILGYTDLKFRMLALRLDFLSVRFMNFERYFQWANITDNSEALIFRRLELILDIFCELIISHCLIQDLGNYSLKHLSLMFWISRNLVCTASDQVALLRQLIMGFRIVYLSDMDGGVVKLLKMAMFVMG